MRDQITAYTIAQETREEALGQVVRGYINQGWQPYLQPYIFDRRHGYSAQAMVKYKSENEDANGFIKELNKLIILADNTHSNVMHGLIEAKKVYLRLITKT